MKNISIIAAVALSHAIGYGNKLLYWLPNDLKRFKTLTTGHTVIMGRKTFESLPGGALPNRRNVVLSRNPDATFEGAEHYSNFEDAIRSCGENEMIFIIGGANVYEQAMKFADHINLTLIEDTPRAADVFFPKINKEVWKETGKEVYPSDEKHPYPYAFIDFSKR